MLSNLFLIARHGTSFLNSQNFYRGWSNGPDANLNGDGIQSAIDLGFFLSKMQTPIRRVICSDLNRAIMTASIISTILGIPEFEVDNRLRPLHVGDLAGKSKEENPMDDYLANKDLQFPNGESVNEFEARQHAVAIELVNQISDGKIQPGELLIVAHVSNIMYWQNVQSGKADSDEYLHETTDLVKPGGLVIVTDETVIPILNWSDVAVDAENALEAGKKMAVS